MAKEILTLAYLKDRVSFDPTTGVFTHNKAFGSRFSIGDRADTPGHAALTGYRLVNLLNQKYLAHRVAWLYQYGDWPAQAVDHINGNRSDNRIENLRQVSTRQNIENQRKPSKRSSTGFLGVFAYGSKFRVRLTVNRKSLHIGMFDNPEDAHQAYIEAKRIYHSGCTL